VLGLGYARRVRLLHPALSLEGEGTDSTQPTPHPTQVRVTSALIGPQMTRPPHPAFGHLLPKEKDRLETLADMSFSPGKRTQAQPQPNQPNIWVCLRTG